MYFSLDNPGVLGAVMERFQKQRLPRILDIKEQVDGGGTLSDLDIAFLEEVFEDTRQYKGFVDQNSEFQDLYTRVVHLYEQIADRALENEKRQPG
jgi:hypothetical protein